MSVDFFMGLEPAFEDWAESGETVVERINRFLVADGWEPYVEPAEIPDVYQDDGRLFGRSSFDHHGRGPLRQVAESLISLDDALGRPSIFGGFFDSLFRAKPLPGTQTPLLLIASTPEFAAFVPGGRTEPVMTDLVNGINQTLFVGSLPILFNQLLEVAPKLGIPLESGVLTDEVARQIDDQQEFSEDDTADLVENLRTAWLLLHEGARLALENKVALSLIQ